MSEIPPGSITLADIFNVLGGIRTDIARALERIAAIDERNRSADLIHLALKEDIDRIERRITSLETFRWKVGGALALLMVLLTAFGAALIVHLHLLCKRYRLGACAGASQGMIGSARPPIPLGGTMITTKLTSDNVLVRVNKRTNHSLYYRGRRMATIRTSTRVYIPEYSTEYVVSSLSTFTYNGWMTSRHDFYIRNVMIPVTNATRQAHAVALATERYALS